ncbi:hypothetical protein [Jeotgalibacillus marinus]
MDREARFHILLLYWSWHVMEAAIEKVKRRKHMFQNVGHVEGGRVHV